MNMLGVKSALSGLALNLGYLDQIHPEPYWRVTKEILVSYLVLGSWFLFHGKKIIDLKRGGGANMTLSYLVL